MRSLRAHRAALAAACVLLSAFTAQPLFAQDSDDRLRRLEERMAEMERRHQEDLRTRDEEIARLRTQAATPTTAPVPASAPATRPATTPSADIDRATADVLKDIDTRSASTSPFRKAGLFTPDIAVISDFTGSFSSNRNNDALNRFDVREIELDFRAAVDPRADAVAILAFERDAENPVFPEGEPLEGPEGSVNVEEAYLFLHDFGVENLTAKVGRFHVRFGRQNMLHLHDLPTSDPPLVNQAFLSPESLSDAGVSLSYVIPPRFTGGQYIEVVGEVLAGEGAGSESAIFTGDITVDSPAFNVHALWNTEVAPGWNLEVGGSFLTGPRGPENDQRANVYGVDLTLLRRDPTGKFNNTLFQAEAMYADVDQESGGTEHALGFYALVQQQLDRDWYVGLRGDWTQDPNDDNAEAYGFSPYVSWYWSEFLRFRLQYQYKTGDVPEEHNVFLQVTWIFGAHPPHPYWAMK